mmetsp:Transcript_15116/g.19118  ORF Transcript_15116/g.19118 Transcript_15116/m.19118 type:complete len:139 (+) Transcript_15116:1274-1690(+)
MQARADYHQAVVQTYAHVVQDNQLIMEESDDSDEFADAMEHSFRDNGSSDAESDDEEAKAEKERILTMVKAWEPVKDLRDDFRHPDAHKDGGFPLNDAAVIGRYRQAFKDIVKQLGRTIFSGKFNIGSVSFPISCMSH